MAIGTYTNPLYPGYLADPFIWRAGGEYYAIGTGPMEAAGEIDEAERAASGLGSHVRVFPILRSDDFLNWFPVGGALLRPATSLGHTFWAPEVAYFDGAYYLYYSVGREDKHHQLRVAVSLHPLGPYEDGGGEALINPRTCPFAIDPHPFQDDDGSWYLFYATDFLNTEDGAHAGTALMVDRMLSMDRLAGEPKTVMRAHWSWQRFQAERPMYGAQWDWFTLEGPAVRKHNGRYYCFYSGGRWETDRYGVDYCVADSVLGPYMDGGEETGPRFLRTVPGHVMGPGHNSFIQGPDRETEFVVYHAWDLGHRERHMCMDRLEWTEGGPRCAGPTWTPQQIQT